MRAAAVLLWAAAAAVALAADAPPPVEVRAHTEPETTTVGSRFRYVLEVSTAPEVEVVMSQPTEHVGEFLIVDFGDRPPVVRDGHTVTTRWFTLVGYTPGDFLTRSPPVFYRPPGEALSEAPGHEILISVESLLAREPNAADIRDIKGLEPVPVDWRPYWLVGGALGLVLAIGATILVLTRRRQGRGLVAAPPPSPHEAAYAALARLLRERLVEAGAFKEYYSALSGVVRVYLEQRFEVRAPEMTTEEFLLASARDGRLHGTHRALLAEFLRECDLVKFARHVPTLADAERAFAAARRFVDETAAGAPRAEEQRCA